MLCWLWVLQLLAYSIELILRNKSKKMLNDGILTFPAPPARLHDKMSNTTLSLQRMCNLLSERLFQSTTKNESGKIELSEELKWKYAVSNTRDLLLSILQIQFEFPRNFFFTHKPYICINNIHIQYDTRRTDSATDRSILVRIEGHVNQPQNQSFLTRGYKKINTKMLLIKKVCIHISLHTLICDNLIQEKENSIEEVEMIVPIRQLMPEYQRRPSEHAERKQKNSEINQYIHLSYCFEDILTMNDDDSVGGRSFQLMDTQTLTDDKNMSPISFSCNASFNATTKKINNSGSQI